jgi:hypothetical protein
VVDWSTPVHHVSSRLMGLVVFQNVKLIDSQVYDRSLLDNE